MAQATSGEKIITIDGEKYFIRTQVVYQDGLGTQGTLSTTAPLRYIVQYKPYRSINNIIPDWSTLGERDINNQNNWTFTPTAGANFRAELAKKGRNSLTNSLDDATANTLSKSANVSKQQANLILQVAPNVDPTVIDPNQAVPSSGGGSTEEEPKITLEEVTSLNFQIDRTKGRKIDEILQYPLKRQSQQDYIKFRVFEYRSQTFNADNFTLERKPYEESLATIYLPIQATISDTNTVNWGEDKFGVLEMIGAGISLDAMGGQTSFEGLANKFANTIKSSDGSPVDPSIVNALKTYFAKMAVSSNNNLLSRLTGAVTNPNLTLLFNSPELRNFNFNFKLTPRTQSEGERVRKIIRAFKEYMAVQRTEGNLFLEAPNIFEIEYIRAKDRFNDKDTSHPSLNRIKKCALRSFIVNYTPAGSYATYNDKAGTMSSYDLTMSFTELDPVYSDDYNRIPDDQIGY